MSETAGDPETLPNRDDPQHSTPNSGPDMVGYLKHTISEVIRQSQIRKWQDDGENRGREGRYPHQNPAKNACISARIGSLFKGGVGETLPETDKERLKGYLKESVQLMSREVDEVTHQVLQICHMRTSLKRKRSRAVESSKNVETGKSSKKQKMMFLARSQAAYRRRMMDIFRECGSILKQIMQHKWYWPFNLPVDVAGMALSNYYDVSKRPVNLRNIIDRIEAEDGSGYSNVHEICEDVRHVFRNAIACNQQGSDVHKSAKALWEKFEEKWRSVLEPKLIQLEEIREEEQGCSDVNGLNVETTLKNYSDEVFKKLSNIEQNLEEFLRASTSKCRQMSEMEKQELVCKIRQLPPSGLNRVVEIIAQENSLDVSTEEIPVDLNEMNPATLWRLYFYLQTVASPNHPVDKG